VPIESADNPLEVRHVQRQVLKDALQEPAENPTLSNLLLRLEQWCPSCLSIRLLSEVPQPLHEVAIVLFDTGAQAVIDVIEQGSAPLLSRLSMGSAGWASCWHTCCLYGVGTSKSKTGGLVVQSSILT